MYCYKCGKKIDYNSIICNECLRGESFFGAEAVNSSASEQPSLNNELSLNNQPSDAISSQKKGLKGAISAAVVSYVSLIFNLCGLVLMWNGVIFASINYGAYSETFLFYGLTYGIAGLIFAIAGIVPSIIGFCKSLRSIKIVRQSRPKPIATLVLGLYGLDMSIANFLMLYYNMVTAIITIAFLAIAVTGGF